MPALACFLALAFQSPQNRAELADLQARASALSKKIKDLSGKVDLTSSDDGLQLLKKYVDDLTEIKDRLRQLQREYEGNHPEPAKTSPDLLKRTTVGALMEFQYDNGNQHGGSLDNGFEIRRLRLLENTLIDSRNAAGFTEDFANGANSQGAWLRDAIFAHEFAGDIPVNYLSDPISQYPNNWIRQNAAKTARLSALNVGQFPLPLGYDLERSQFDLEFLERSLYNTAYFYGQRSRGVEYRQGLAPGAFAEAGVFDALTTDDPEQSNLASAAGNSLVETLGVRTTGPQYSAGVNGLIGTRPAYTTGSGKSAVTSPETQRRFVYMDGTIHNIAHTKLFARGELVYGHDRVPNATASPALTGNDLNAFQAHLGYAFDSKNELNLRWQQLNPDVHKAGSTINAFGGSYRYFFTPHDYLALVYQVYTDPSRAATFMQQRYDQMMLRFTIRF